jgi:hypothetical protein
MGDSILFGWLIRAHQRRKRERDLQLAATWPTASAKILKGKTVPKDELTEGSLAQTFQLECQYYFELPAGFFGGHVRSVACSDSEGRRWVAQLDDNSRVIVRYDPANPDRTHTLATDNEGTLPFTVWST